MKRALQKPGTVLVKDRFDRALSELRVSVTDQCNFRCTYCMPEDLFAKGDPFIPLSRQLGLESTLAAIDIFAELGVSKVKITGGEPLLQPWVVRLVEAVAADERITDLGLITNGFHLEQMAAHLYSAGLRRITVSVDSLREETFAAMTGRSGALAKVLAGIHKALELGFAPVKINMVVQRGVNDDEIVPMTEYFLGLGCELRFIEYMDTGARHRWEKKYLVPSQEIREKVLQGFSLREVPRSRPGEPSVPWTIPELGGNVGFISSVTEPFCNTCDRMRLTADGFLYRCLYTGIGRNIGKMLSELPREEVLEQIAGFWRLRTDRYSELRGTEAAGEAAAQSLAEVEREAADGEADEAGSKADAIKIIPDKIEMYRMGG